MSARSVVIERDLAHPPEKVWRALTEPHLVAEWLMRGDFRAETGRPYRFEADWGSVAGKVVAIDPPRRMEMTWGDAVLATTVTWTLTPTPQGTHLRMEQAGFRTDQPASYYGGARAGWPQFLDGLERVLGQMESEGGNP